MILIFEFFILNNSNFHSSLFNLFNMLQLKTKRQSPPFPPKKTPKQKKKKPTADKIVPPQREPCCCWKSEREKQRNSNLDTNIVCSNSTNPDHINAAPFEVPQFLSPSQLARRQKQAHSSFVVCEKFKCKYILKGCSIRTEFDRKFELCFRLVWNFLVFYTTSDLPQIGLPRWEKSWLRHVLVLSSSPLQRGTNIAYSKALGWKCFQKGKANPAGI